MARFHRFIAAAALSGALAACVAATPPVEVTRFHNAQSAQIVPGTVAVTSSADGANSGPSLEHRTYAAAVMRELQRVGFADIANDPAGNAAVSEYVARLSVERERLTADGRRSPVSVGVGGSTGSYGSGVGIGLGINLSGKPKDRIATQLSVQIAKRADQTVIWEGRAAVDAKDGSPASQPGLAASKLAEALFSDFPGQSGETISVP